MSKGKRQAKDGRGRGAGPSASGAAPSALGKAFMWFVVLTCAAVIVMLIWYARGILGELRLVGNNANASTRLLIALFVVMTFGGFVAAGFWAALKKALGREEKQD